MNRQKASLAHLVALLLYCNCGFGAALREARELAVFKVHSSFATGIAFSPDGERLLIGSLDPVAKIYDLKSNREVLSVPGHEGGIWSVAYSPDGSQFAAGCGDGGNRVRLSDAQTGQLVRTFPSPRGGTDWLASGPFRRSTISHGQRVEIVGFSPDGKRVLSGGHDGRVILWDAATGDAVLTLGKNGGSWIHAAAYSPDGQRVAIGCYDGKLTLWSAHGGQPSDERQPILTFAGHTNAIEYLAFFPNGERLVTASYDGTARIWNTRTAEEMFCFRGHQGFVTSVAVSPDGKRVATGGSDETVRVWDPESGEERFVLRTPKGSVECVTFSPDGRKVAATSLDGVARVWDVSLGVGMPASGADSRFEMESDYIPLGVRFHRDPANREIRSFRIAARVPRRGDGSAEVWLDSRKADLNAFGDVVRRTGPEPGPLRVELRYESTGVGPSKNRQDPWPESPASRGCRRYRLVFPSGALAGSLDLILATANSEPHRLMAYDGIPVNGREQWREPRHIIPLSARPPKRFKAPKTPLGPDLNLTGYYCGSDGRIHRLGFSGTSGGAAKFDLDPNFVTFDPYGEPVMSTLIGYQPTEVSLKAAGLDDPLKLGRKLYWADSGNSMNTNRVALVLGPGRIGPHRILLYLGEELAMIVPAKAAQRSR